jgi:small subunit ribosomal protein S8
MTISDPIGDMLTRIRNALLTGHKTVSIPSSKLKLEIARILDEEGYIEGYEEAAADDRPHKTLRITLKYVGERRSLRPVISGIERVSRPGSRSYVNKRQIPWVRSGMGVSILTTPKGVMTGVKARKMGLGGEVICHIW